MVWESFEDKIAWCIQRAVDDYFNLPSQQQARYNATTRANIINSNMVFHVNAEFNGIDGTRLSEADRSFKMYLEGTGASEALKFKKLDQHRRPSSIPTLQWLAFSEQQGMLPGFWPTTNYVAGYVWNELQTAVRIFVVRPNGRRIEWSKEIFPPREQQASFLLPLPGALPPARHITVKQPSPDVETEANG